ncbi:MAG: hypothetical protein QW273_00750 [Candidatus Pacearchaeota archaeon]
MNPEKASPYPKENVFDPSFVLASIEEKINFLEEKLSLLTRNFIEMKEDLQKKIEVLEKETISMKIEVENLKKKIIIFNEDLSNFVRKDDLVLIERMLKDFQPLEFVRKKDLEESLEKIKKEINDEE